MKDSSINPIFITDNFKYFYLMPYKIADYYNTMSYHTNISVGELIDYALISYIGKNKDLDKEGLWVPDDGDRYL